MKKGGQRVGCRAAPCAEFTRRLRADRRRLSRALVVIRHDAQVDFAFVVTANDQAIVLLAAVAGEREDEALVYDVDLGHPTGMAIDPVVSWHMPHWCKQTASRYASSRSKTDPVDVIASSSSARVPPRRSADDRAGRRAPDSLPSADRCGRTCAAAPRPRAPGIHARPRGSGSQRNGPSALPR